MRRPFRVGEKVLTVGVPQHEVEIAYVNSSASIVSVRYANGDIEDFCRAHWFERPQAFAGKYRKWGHR